MSCDYDYHKRMAELAALMLAHPRTRMKKLQKSALRAFPVASRELYRHCMGWKFAFSAAALANSDIPLADYN